MRVTSSLICCRIPAVESPTVKGSILVDKARLTFRAGSKVFKCESRLLRLKARGITTLV
jgi:hypothetical protein